MGKKMQTHSENKIICNWCGSVTQIIWVHGHGQCANCGINIEECCKGEVCQTPNEQVQEAIEKSFDNEQ